MFKAATKSYFHDMSVSSPLCPFCCFTLLFQIIAFTAHADELDSARRQQIIEHEHQVSVELHDGYAIYNVRRSFSTPGKRPEQVELNVEIPEGASATKLALLGKDKWHQASD